MKKRNLLVILSLSAVTLMTSCGGNSSKRPSITSKVVKDLCLYSYNEYSKSFVKYSSYSYKTYFFNDSSIPYFSIKDYTKSFLNILSTETYKCDVHDGSAYISLSNPNFKGQLTINTDAQTLSYDSYSGYFTNSTDLLYPLSKIIAGGEYLFKDLKYEYTPGSIFTIDLTKYNIKAFYDNNDVYLPYHIAMAALGNNSTYYIYNGNGFYIFPTTESLTELFNVNKLIKDAIANKAFDKEYMQYAYDHLAFIFDNYYGLDKREMRTGSKETYTFFKDGAYKALEKYKSDLISTKDNVSDEALCRFFLDCVNDGGHSSYRGYNIFTTRTTTVPISGDNEYTTDAELALRNARLKVGLDPAEKGDDFTGFVETRIDEQSKNKVLFVTMDQFAPHEDKYTREHFSDTEYGKCAITTLGKANEIIQNDNSIKNVVIDMSCNTGGAAYMPLEMLSWINKGNMNFVNRNKNDGTIFKGSGHADVNLDGVFDNKDYLADDVNVYVICSPTSYSSGNYFPCIASEVSKVKFIGERSGGGSCNISGTYNAYGSKMYMSGNSQLCFNNLRDGKLVSDEEGVTPTFYQIPLPYDDYTNAPKYFDRKTIVNKIFGK